MINPRPRNRIFLLERSLKIRTLCIVCIVAFSGCPVITTLGDISIHESDHVASIAVDNVLFDDWHNGSSHIISDSNGDGSHYEKILNVVYEHFRDDFDLIFLISNIPEGSLSVNSSGYYGLLISDTYTHDDLGLSNLKGIVHLPFISGIASGPLLHEILHLYANFSIETFAIIGMDDDGFPVSGRQYGHWGYTSTGYGKTIPFIGEDYVEFSMGGQLGGFSTSELIVVEDPGPNGIGTWRIKGGFGSFANEGNSVPYADIELYLMGLDPQNTFTEDIVYFSDFQSLSTEDRDENIWYTGCHYPKKHDYVFTAKKNLFPLSELSRDRPEAQTQLKALALVLTRSALDAATWSSVDDQVRSFSKNGSDDNDCSYNFYEATFGQARIEMGELSLSLND